VPTGNHLARCYRIIDLGTQRTNFKGVPGKSPKLIVQWEVHGQDDDGYEMVTSKGEPMSISKTYTASLNENSNFYSDVLSWRNKPFTKEELDPKIGFELETLLGTWCMLTVIHSESNDKVYANVDKITPVPLIVKKNGLPPQYNEAKIFYIKKPDMKLFETFSDFLKNKIAASIEWEKQNVDPKQGIEEDDDIPF
jgi:hypothetical protein